MKDHRGGLGAQAPRFFLLVVSFLKFVLTDRKQESMNPEM